MGTIEVFHKTLKYERVYVQECYQTFYEAQDDLDVFIRYYADERPHQALQYVTPRDSYEGRAEALIARRNRNHQQAMEERERRNREQALSQAA